MSLSAPSVARQIHAVDMPSVDKFDAQFRLRRNLVTTALTYVPQRQELTRVMSAANHTRSERGKS